jgi:hypothetical protein
MTDEERRMVYEQGKRAYQRDYGTHGPTLRPRIRRPQVNPYTGLAARVWDAGYRQDVRRVS